MTIYTGSNRSRASKNTRKREEFIDDERTRLLKIISSSTSSSFWCWCWCWFILFLGFVLWNHLELLWLGYRFSCYFFMWFLNIFILMLLLYEFSFFTSSFHFSFFCVLLLLFRDKQQITTKLRKESWAKAEWHKKDRFYKWLCSTEWVAFHFSSSSSTTIYYPKKKVTENVMLNSEKRMKIKDIRHSTSTKSLSSSSTMTKKSFSLLRILFSPNCRDISSKSIHSINKNLFISEIKSCFELVDWNSSNGVSRFQEIFLFSLHSQSLKETRCKEFYLLMTLYIYIIW
jgi:hypothetical protein